MEEPTITLPLSEFLKILWGYKKDAELRDRAAPGDAIIEAIKVIPNYQEYVYLQEPTPEEPKFQTQVWQIHEWKTSGERFYHQKKESEKQNYNVDAVSEAISRKLPMLDKNFVRTLAYGVCEKKDFSSLSMFGITEQDLKL